MGSKVSGIRARVCHALTTAFLIAAVLPAEALAQPDVDTVPWVPANRLIPHDTWSGKEITLKAVADLQGANILYTWDFGDGSPVVSGTVSDRYVIEARHSYVGNPGDVFTARVTVEDTGSGETGSDIYIVQIREQNLATEVNVAIDEGLWYLHRFQTRTTEGGIDFGDWRTRSGCLACTSFQSITPANLNAFAAQGHTELGDADNPYTETVQRGMRRLFTYLTAEGLSNRTYPAPTGTVNPDSNGNGLGIRINQSSYPYQGGMFMDAIITAGRPDTVATTGPANVTGRTYADIVQDMVDSYAFGQYNVGGNRGGWRYVWNQAPDNSAAQWAAIGMIPAEREWGLTVPDWVKTENQVWLGFSQTLTGVNRGRFGYANTNPSSWGPYAVTPSGMVQMVMNGVGRGDDRWNAAEGYIRDRFGATCTSTSTVVCARAAIKDYYYGLFSFVKSMRLHNPPIEMLGSENPGVEALDWYGAELAAGAPTDGVARTLVRDQHVTGYWDQNYYHSHQRQYNTSFAILMLGQTLFDAGAPVAVAEATPNPGIAGQIIQLNASNSFHQDAERQLVAWEWDLDNDGTYETSGPLTSVSFPTLGDFPVGLRVTDDDVEPNTAETILTIRITTPPIAPTADAGGPYSFCPGQVWFLDASASNNPDEGQSEPGLPGDTIAAWAWDLDGNGAFDDASGEQTDVTDYFTALGTGDYLVRLQVTDTTATAYPSSGFGDLSDIDAAQVRVRDASDAVCACIADLASRPKSGKVQLTWTDNGATSYNVYRSTTAGGPYTLLANTTSRYSTWLDQAVENGTRYYYVVREVLPNGTERCQSNETSSTPSGRRSRVNNPPIFTSTPVTNATEGIVYTYDADAVDAEGDALTYALDLAPAGMTIDAVTGLIVWTPLNAQVGTQSVIVQVSDAGGNDTQTFQIVVTSANSAPVIVSTPVTSATENVPYSYDADAVDSDVGDVLTYSLDTAPAGMAIDPSSGQIDWTPNASQTGSATVSLRVTDTGGLADTQTWTIVVLSQNLPPSITSTPVVNAAENQAYTYAVQASDPNAGDVLMFALDTAPAGMSIDADTGLIEWTPTTAQIGTAPVAVRVEDTGGLSSVQSYVITVANVNDAPTIVSSPIVAATQNLLYAYDAEASDPDTGDTLTFSLGAAPAGMSVDPATGLVQWTPGPTQIGPNSVTLRVADAGGLTDEQTFTITVANINDAPAIVSAPPVVATEGEAYVYDVEAVDADAGDVLTFSLDTAPAGMTIDPATGLIQWTPASGQLGANAVQVRVVDGSSAFATQAFSINVSQANVAPVITSVPVVTATQDVLYAYDVEADDANGDALTFSLDSAPAGMSIDPVTGLVQWTPNAAQLGANAVAVRAADPDGAFATQSFTVNVLDPNIAPAFTSVPPVTGTEDQLYTYDADAVDGNGDTLTFSLDVAPAGMTIDPVSGLVQWTPGAGQTGANGVGVRVADTRGGFATQSFTIQVAQAARAPVIISAPNPDATEGQIYTYDVNANDGNGDTLTYGLDVAPAGMGIDPVNGLITWTPGNAQVGANAVAVRVSDPGGLFATQSFNVTVANVNDAPAITSTPPVAAIEDELYSYDVEATDVDAGDLLTFSLDTAPAGMTIDATSGLIQWTPDAAQVGANPVAVRVSDTGGLFATQTFTVNVTSGNVAPQITSSPPLTSVAAGDLYTYDVDAVDANNDSLTFSLDAAPTGMSIDPASGLIQWSPDATQQGANAVTVRVADPEGLFDAQSFVVTVTLPNQAPTIISSPVASATVDALYNYDVDATDPDAGDLLTYSLDVAPTGMSIDATSGLISWTPGAGQIGANDVTIRVADTGGLFATQAYSIVVTDAADLQRPEVTLGLNSNAVLIGESITLTVTASDDIGVVSLQATVDGAPVALDAGGQGTYTQAGAGIVTFVATATDAAGNTGTATQEARFLSGAGATPPTVQISTPASGTELQTIVDVVGTANDTDLVRYLLELADSNTNEYVRIGEGTSAVVNGVLGQIDPTQLRNGAYDLRLTAEDANGNIASTVTSVQLDGENSVGNFTLAFEDLVIPVSGIDISITRVYDSRIKTAGDFGVGWKLVLNDFRVQENAVLGEGWQQNVSGGFFPTYTVVPSRPHYVRVTGPDGESHRFDFRVTSGGSVLFPYSLTNPVNVDFLAESGSGAELQPLGVSNSLPVLGGVSGSVTLLEDFGLDEYDPDRYLFTAEDGTQVLLNQNGGIEQITDNNGNTITFTAGGLIHSSGKSVTFTRDSQGRITAITDPNGNVINYEYDFYGDLVAVTDQATNRSSMTYNSSHGLVDFFDPRGVRPSRTEYDADGRMAAIVDAQGNRMEFTHEVADNREVIRDRRGNVTLYEYDDRGNIIRETNPLGFVEIRTYDADGNVLTRTDANGNTVAFTYDALGRRTSESDALGNTSSSAYDSRGRPVSETDKNGNTTSYTYDASGNQTRTVDALGNAMDSTFDGDGNRLTTVGPDGASLAYTYDGSGNQTSYTDFSGVQTDYTYDANGNRLSETVGWTDSTGTSVALSTSYVYDALNRIVSEVDPLGNATFTEFNSIGEMSAMVDKNGNRTEFEYDARKNRVRTLFPDGTEETATFDAEKNRTSRTDRQGRTTTYAYDDANRLIGTTHPDGSTESTEYDGAGLKVATVDVRGNRTEFSYDAAGRLIAETDPLGNITTYTLDANGNRTAITDANGNTRTFVYDALNRVVQVNLPDGTSTAKTYDARGLVAAETDPAGNTTTYAYNALQQLTQVTDALGNVTQFTYDELGNRTSQTDGNGNLTTWAYDGLGRVISRTLPLGQQETMRYDANGNLVEHTDFNGNTSTYTYDVNNRRVGAEYADGSITTWTWSTSGRMTSETDANGTTVHLYDSRDRLVQTTRSDGSTIAYGYDAAGNRTQVTTPNTATMYVYDALNRLSQAVDGADTTSYTYDAVGNRTRVDHANGSSVITSYDNVNRLIALDNQDAGGVTVAGYTYTLDAVGNRVSVAENNGRIVAYTYDALHRLTGEAEAGRTVVYTYDAAGNRLSRLEDGTLTNYVYDANDRLVSEGAVTYTWDANGNQLSRTEGTDVTLNTFDARNRLAGVTEGGVSSTYTYDDDGSLRSATSGGVTTSYLIDKNVDERRGEVARVLEETSGGALQVTYRYGDDLLSQDRGGVVRVYHYDGLGSTRALSDNSAAITDTYTYDAFGELLSSTGSTDNDYLFAGEQFDPNSGYYYLRARWYQPNAGRFLSMDTFPGVARDPITLHKYLYGNADPVNMIDPTGNFAMAATMPGLAIRIALPTINYALLLARVIAVTKVVATAAVASCAASQAISTFTALTGPVPGCNTKGANIFYTGADTPLTTAHIGTAMLGHAGPLNRISPKHPRGWLRSDPRCKGNVARLTGNWCDEYPFASVRQGGQANGASLRLVPAWEQILQGGQLGSFYVRCNIVPNDPIKGLYAVAFGPITIGVCGGPP